MTMNQPRTTAQLIVEAGFAGINYGLHKEVRIILQALPDWLAQHDPQVLDSCQAILLFGLDQPKAAAKVLTRLPETECTALRSLL